MTVVEGHYLKMRLNREFEELMPSSAIAKALFEGLTSSNSLLIKLTTTYLRSQPGKYCFWNKSKQNEKNHNLNLKFFNTHGRIQIFQKFLNYSLQLKFELIWSGFRPHEFDFLVWCGPLKYFCSSFHL